MHLCACSYFIVFVIPIFLLAFIFYVSYNCVLGLLYTNGNALSGNVLTSQRVTDVVLMAFGACANSQVPSHFIIRLSHSLSHICRRRRRSRVIADLSQLTQSLRTHPNLSTFTLLMRACVFAQGCMNNLTFGDEHMGYYETIAGGGGAGPTWNGQHGICLHILSSHTLTLPNTYIVMLRQCSNERGVQMNATLSCTHLCMLLVYATIRPLKWPS